MSKNEGALETQVVDSDGSLDGFNGTSEDARDMHRLGRAQELKVYVAWKKKSSQTLTLNRETSVLSRFWA